MSPNVGEFHKKCLKSKRKLSKFSMQEGFLVSLLTSILELHFERPNITADIKFGDIYLRYLKKTSKWLLLIHDEFAESFLELFSKMFCENFDKFPKKTSSGGV